MQSTVPLEELLRIFNIGKVRAEELAENIRDRSDGTTAKLEKLALECDGKFRTFFGTGGMATSASYGWLNIELGEAFFRLGELEKAHQRFYIAWRILIGSLVGDNVNPHKLVHEFPALLNFKPVAEYYRNDKLSAGRYGIIVP